MRSPPTAVMPFCLSLMMLLLTLYTTGVNSQDAAADSGCESLTNSSSCCANSECAFYTSCNKTASKQVCMNVSATKEELKAKCGVETAQDTCAKVIAGVCESQNSSTCCDHEGCQYITCFSATNSSQIISGCYNKTDTATLNTTCSQESDRNNSCSTAVKDLCTASDADLSTCCGVDGCAWVNCTKDKEVMKTGVCANATQLVSVCESGETAKDTCPAAPSPTEAPQTTSSTQTPPVVCTDFTKSEDCCKKSDTCGWINCTSTDGQTELPKCLQNVPSEISKVCKATTDVNLCSVPIATTTTTPAPKPAPPSKTGQHFDGASFVGGMILAFGVVALVYFGCKCYKAKQERNYHTL